MTVRPSTDVAADPVPVDVEPMATDPVDPDPVEALGQTDPSTRSVAAAAASHE